LKILGPFAVVCLVLLAVAVWQLLSFRSSAEKETALNPESQRQAATSSSPRKVAACAPHAVDPRKTIHGTRPAGRRPLPLDGPESAPGGRPSSQPATRLTSALDQEHSRTPATAPSGIRWAADAQRRLKQRFIELREVLAVEPDNERALEAALELARELDWHNEACDLLARLVQLRPDESGLRFELATLLMQLERWVEAIPHLRVVARQEPENAHAWYNLAIAHQALGHLHDARATWSHVIELMPQNSDAYAHRGEVLLDLHDWAAAAADFERVRQLEPGSLDVAMNLALALSKLGRLEDARAALLPVLAQNPEHVPVLNRLAEIAWALYQADPAGNEALSDEALNYCLRSLAIHADQPGVRELLERATAAGE
jgi:predicted Zn-dependent protease